MVLIYMPQAMSEAPYLMSPPELNILSHAHTHMHTHIAQRKTVHSSIYRDDENTSVCSQISDW